MQQYYLCDKIYLCIVDNHCVFLNLHSDQYLCLEPDKIAALKALFGDSSQNASESDISQLANDLLSRGLITSLPNGRNKLSAPELVKPTKDLIGFDLGKRPKIRTIHILRFLNAAISSAIRLRWQPLDRVIDRVKRKKTRFKKRHANRVRTNVVTNNRPARLRELVEVFNQLRPLLFTAQNQCLYDALALNEFLNKYDIYPNMVFGVKMGPFAAHCWVQKDDIVLNDQVAMTLLQTPIMVV